VVTDTNIKNKQKGEEGHENAVNDGKYHDLGKFLFFCYCKSKMGISLNLA